MTEYSLQECKQVAERVVNRMHGVKLAGGDGDGVWRTVRGKKISIKKGQSVKDAMGGSFAGKKKETTAKDAVQRRKEGFKAGAEWLKKNASKFGDKSERDLADALIKELKKSTGMDIEYGDVDNLMYSYADGEGGVKIPKK